MSAFVSHDREDAQGIRAEVHVNTIKGKVKTLDDSNPKSAKATFTVEWLKFPVGGWISKDEAAFTILQEAFANGDEVEARIESKRKKGIDRSLPITELRKSAEEAQKNVTSIIVAVNGVYTSEALTHPSEDPVTGDAQQALPVDAGAPRQTSTGGGSVASVEQTLATLKKLSTTREVSQSVIDAVAASALIAGATPEQVLEASSVSHEQPALQQGYSYEAPSYKDYNSDGRTNLGNYTITASVGAESFVNGTLRDLTGIVKPATVEFYTQLVLAIADRLQVSAYGDGFRLDRSASSHTRIRGIVYDVIKHEFALPLTESSDVPSSEVVSAWVQSVGKRARSRFLFAVKVAHNAPGTAAIIATLDNNGDDVSPAATTQAPTREVAPEPTPTQTPEPTPEVVVEPEEVVEEEAPASQPQTVAEPTPTVESVPEAVQEAPVASSDELLTFPSQILAPGAINAQNTPSEETIEQFKEFIQDGMGLKDKSDLAKVGKLLAQTFGKSYNKAQNIPEEFLQDFMDFYIGYGEENFRRVLATF